MSKMSNPVRISYWVVAVAFLVVAYLQMTSAMLAGFFCYFAITKLHFTRSRWVAVVLSAVVLLVLGYVSIHFIAQAVHTFPIAADSAVSSVTDWAQRHGVELPFTDYESLRRLIKEKVLEQAHDLK